MEKSADTDRNLGIVMSADQKQIADLGKKLEGLESSIKALDGELTAVQANVKKSLRNEDQKRVAKLRKQITELEDAIQTLDGELTDVQVDVNKGLQKLRADLQAQNDKMRKALRDLETQIAESFH